MSLINSRSAISLPGSADGVTPYGSPAGPTRSLSGPAPVPASRSRARASGKGTGTRGICGRRSGGSSAREQVAGKDGRLWLARVRTDLEALAYAVGAADLCAASVSAPHIRQRLFWVADAGGDERRPPSEGGYVVNGSHAGREEAAGGFGFHVAHAVGLGDAAGARPFSGSLGGIRCGEEGIGARDVKFERPSDATGVVVNANGCHEHWWSGALQVGWNCIAGEVERSGGKHRAQWRVKPGVPLLADGIPGRVAQLCGFGNAIVPQLAAEFIVAFCEIA